jgi:hypothetical protein
MVRAHTGRMASRTSTRPDFTDITPLDRRRVLPLGEVTELTGLSRDSIYRHYGHLIRRLSPRRVGMRLGDALKIGEAD